MYNAIIVPNGLLFCDARTMSPASGVSSSGVSIVTDPSFDCCGHNGASLVPNPICAGEQAARAAADDGETDTPSGKTIFTWRTCACERPSGSAGCGTDTSTSKPEGPSAECAKGLTSVDGLKPRRSQPSKEMGTPCSSAETVR